MSTAQDRVPLRVLHACTGLGRERRGFEAFTRDCAEALRGERSLAITVLAGGRDGHVEGEEVIWNLPRASRAAKLIGAVSRRDPYFIEQGTFFLGALGALRRHDPDLIYFADLNLGNALWHWRQRTGARWRMLFYNGGNTTMPFTRCDHVQLMTPAALDGALARGESSGRMTVLPHGVAIAPFRAVAPSARRLARAELGLPGVGEVLLSVAQLDRATKRTHLLIDAVAALPEPRPFLFLVGADGPDGLGLRELARAKLEDGWKWMTLPRERMPLAYAAADRFAMLSHGEGFGLAYVEAIAAGLPLLVHDDATTRYVVAETGIRRDIRTADDARAGLVDLLKAPIDEAAARARHASVQSRFGWEAMRPKYVELFHRVAERA